MAPLCPAACQSVRLASHTRAHTRALNVNAKGTRIRNLKGHAVKNTCAAVSLSECAKRPHGGMRAAGQSTMCRPELSLPACPPSWCCSSLHPPAFPLNPNGVGSTKRACYATSRPAPSRTCMHACCKVGQEHGPCSHALADARAHTCMHAGHMRAVRCGARMRRQARARALRSSWRRTRWARPGPACRRW